MPRKPFPAARGCICIISRAIWMSVPERWIFTPARPRTPVLRMSDILKSWNGYLRPDGRKGVRNLVLIVYTVECAQHVAHAIASGEDDTHVIGFPGCYDNAYAIR